MTEIEQLISIWRDRPDLFFKQALGVESLEQHQYKILDAIAKHSRVAVRATHSISKTYTLGRVPLWFLTCFENSKVITTAPTYRQVAKLLWGELRSAHKKAVLPIGGHLTTTELKIDDDWYAIGFSPKKDAGDDREQKGSSFQGFHANHIMIIFDEATGVEADVWKMAEGLLTSGVTVKFVAIGNPTMRNCEFFKCFTSPEWFKVGLSCFDSPNLVANGITDLNRLKRTVRSLKQLSDDERLAKIESFDKPVPYLLTAQWVISKAIAWGVEHPLFRSKARGLFPKTDDNVIVSFENIETATERDIRTSALDKRYMSVDVARFGVDNTVLTDMIGFKQVNLETIVKRDTVAVANATRNMIITSDEYQRETVCAIDATGIGSGVLDQLVAWQDEGRIGEHVFFYEMHYAFSSPDEHDEGSDKIQFENIKAAMYFKLNQDLKENLDIFSESVYLEETPTIKYKFTTKGKLKIESKEDYKKRTGSNSPDHSDGLAMANFARYVEVDVGDFQKDSGGEREDLTTKYKSGDTVNRISNRIKIKEY